jgi:hypothetical protein
MDITKMFKEQQCPQFWIFIGAAVLGTLVTLKMDGMDKTFAQLVALALIVVLLVGSNYCKWPWQWITWVFAAFSALGAIGNLALLMTPKEELTHKKEVYSMEELYD